MTQAAIQHVEVRRRDPEKGMEWVRDIEAEIAKVQPSVLATLGKIERAVVLAKSIDALRRSLTPERMAPIMALQNTPLGFRTDKPDGGYPVEVVKECVIEACIIGVDVVGNQFNIIARRCYVTREGMSKLCRDFQGLTDLRIEMGVPVGKGDGSIVPCETSWMLNGVRDELKGNIPVRVNVGMGADAILGKADRKIKARIYSRITGSEFTHEGEVDDAEPKSTKAADTQAAIDALKQTTQGAKREEQAGPAPASSGSAPTPKPSAQTTAAGNGQQERKPWDN